MKIALLGYGKMGKIIEQTALQRGHTIILRHDAEDSLNHFNQADVAIEFSVPEAAFQNVKTALENNIPIVSGTTGWTQFLPEIEKICTQLNGSFIYASNFSLGVNLFFEINKYVAQLMQPFEYEASINEIHHIHKKDAPSGTAITLAEQLLPFTNKNEWQLQTVSKDILTITAQRLDEVPGTHTITYQSAVDDISLTHTAYNRNGFALGAVLAAEYIHNKKGIFTMKNVLGL